MNKKILILAPHLEYPPRNGADIYVEKIGCYLSINRDSIALLGANTLTNFENGVQVGQENFKNIVRSKNWAAMRTLVHRTNYLAEKFLTPSFKTQAEKLLIQYSNTLTICSTTVTANLLKKIDISRPVVILTENDEIAWFQNQRRNSCSPLLKLCALFSEHWSVQFLRQHSQDYVYIHIAETDQAAYEKIIPGHRNFVVPAGVELHPLPALSAWDGKIRLLFVGSLSVKMNYDALTFFYKKFWPVLKSGLEDMLEIWVAGSMPTAEVRSLCRGEGWKLFANLSDENLHDLYGRATFGILPFPYTTGAKLKLLNMLAAGLPVLATTNMLVLPGQDFTPNLYSDIPQDWLLQLQIPPQKASQQEICRQFAARYNWKEIVTEMDDNLRKFGI